MGKNREIALVLYYFVGELLHFHEFFSTFFVPNEKENVKKLGKIVKVRWFCPILLVNCCVFTNFSQLFFASEKLVKNREIAVVLSYFVGDCCVVFSRTFCKFFFAMKILDFFRFVKIREIVSFKT